LNKLPVRSHITEKTSPKLTARNNAISLNN
jgi:hypothetical protein